MLKPIKIGANTISTSNSPFIIAEISANHNGSIERALDTIKAAKLCGAHAVKIQTYTPDTMTIDCNHKDFKIQKGIWKGKHFMSYMVRHSHLITGIKNYLVMLKKLVSLFFLLPLTKPRWIYWKRLIHQL